jgi:hypothetical protein
MGVGVKATLGAGVVEARGVDAGVAPAAPDPAVQAVVRIATTMTRITVGDADTLTTRAHISPMSGRLRGVFVMNDRPPSRPNDRDPVDVAY